MVVSQEECVTMTGEERRGEERNWREDIHPSPMTMMTPVSLTAHDLLSSPSHFHRIAFRMISNIRSMIMSIIHQPYPFSINSHLPSLIIHYPPLGKYIVDPIPLAATRERKKEKKGKGGGNCFHAIPAERSGGAKPPVKKRLKRG